MVIEGLLQSQFANLDTCFCRFDFSRLHGKVTRHVQFPEKLDVRPYMSLRQVGDSGSYQGHNAVQLKILSANSASESGCFHAII